MSFSKHQCSLKMAMNNSRNMWKWFTIHGQMQFVGNKLILVYQLHRGGTILRVLQHVSVIIPAATKFPPRLKQHEPEEVHRAERSECDS